MTTTTDHQHGFISHAYSRDGNLRPALITARHWEDGDFEIVIRPLSRPHHLIILDRDDINAVIDGDGLLRPALITARHWSDGDIEIAIRPLHIPDACIIIDPATTYAV